MLYIIWGLFFMSTTVRSSFHGFATKKSTETLTTTTSSISRPNILSLPSHISPSTLSPIPQTNPKTQSRYKSHPPVTSLSRYVTDKKHHYNPGRNHPCFLQLPLGCSCTKLNGALSLSCSKAMLTVIPRSWNADIGPTLVRSMNLERNNITAINDGDFFGLKIERLILAHNHLRRLEFLAFWGLEYNLQTLDLGYNRFDKLPTDALRLLQNLRTLTLTGNHITALWNFDFGYMRKLEVLTLDSNPLSAISLRTFSGTRLIFVSMARIHLNSGLSGINTDDMKHMKGLSLAHNKIHNIGEGCFENLKNLWYLNMADNRIRHLPRNDTFGGLERSLINLDLSGNRFSEIPILAVRTLRRLETLDLSRNLISELGNDLCWFSMLVSLQSLNFSSNRIKQISEKAFDCVSLQIRVIDLRNNRLTTLSETTFQRYSNNGLLSPTPTKRVDIYLAGNRWLCNCLLRWLRQQLKQQQQHVQHQQQQQELQRQQHESSQERHQAVQQKHLKLSIEFLSFANLTLVFADADDIRCDRPHFLAGVTLTKAAARDYTCTNDYYYYYYDDHVNSYDDDSDNENLEGSGVETQLLNTYPS